MPKHNRSNSSSHGRYSNQMPATLVTSPMYGGQRLAIPAIPEGYYTIPSSTTGMPLHSPQQPHPHEDMYEQYTVGTSQPVTVSPPLHRASSGAWAPHEDQQLVQARMQGLNWGQIREHYFPTKSPNACRKRHERLMERKGSDDWDNQKFQRMAREYIGMRKEIWSGLAERTGEKWTVVEQKCLSSGYKNLQSASRAASRREALETRGSLNGYDDDSGISGIGLTPVDELDAPYNSPNVSPVGPQSASSGASGYQHLHPHAQLQPLAVNQPSYGMSGYGANYDGHHGYSSSVSSSASAGHGYAAHAKGNSRGGSPYMGGQRLPSADMGIEAIINRPRGTRG